MTTLPWIEKYRPVSLDEVINHDDKVVTMKKLADTGELPHLLLTGPPGTGKTSFIINLARYIYGENYRDFIRDINGSSERGIDTIRNTVISFIQNKSSKTKLIILDEAEALTNEAQNALKSVIEIYSKWARFCLVCNDSSKIISALHSRCCKLVFTYLDPPMIKQRLSDIVQKENINITEDALEYLVNHERDFRQVINLLQSVKVYSDATDIEMTKENIIEYLGQPSEEKLDMCIQTLFGGTHDAIVSVIKDLCLSGEVDLLILVGALSDKLTTMDSINLDQKILLFSTLSDIERKIRTDCSQNILIHLLAATFLKVRFEMAGKKK